MERTARSSISLLRHRLVSRLWPLVAASAVLVGLGVPALVYFQPATSRVSSATSLGLLLVSVPAAVGLALLVYFRTVTAVTRIERQLRELLASGHLLAARLDRQEVLDRLAEMSRSLLEVDVVRILLRDETSTAMIIGSETGAPGLAGQRCRVDATASVAAAILGDGRAVVLDDVLADPRLNARQWFDVEGIRSFLGVPLVVDRGAVGILACASLGRRAWSSHEVALAGGLAAAAAVALANARLFAEERARRACLTTLLAITEKIGAMVSTEALLTSIADEAARLLELDNAGFRLLEGDDLVLMARAGGARETMVRPRLKIGESLSGRVVQEGRPLIIDLASAPDMHVEASRRLGYTSFLGVPLKVGDRTTGVLAFRGRRPFTDGDRELAELFAGQAAIALEHARLIHEADQRRRTAESLGDVSRLISQSLDLDEVGQRIADSVLRLLGVRSSALYRLDTVSGDLAAIALAGDLQPPFDRKLVFPVGTGVAGLAVLERAPVVVRDVLTDPRVTLPGSVRASFEHGPYRAVLAAPLLVGDRVVGAIGVRDTASRTFSPEDIELLGAFASQAALTLENARLFAETQAQAAALREKNGELDSFVYSVSHDLKSPLVTIQGMSSVLLEDYAGRFDAAGRHYIERIQANTAQMERLIEDLLALSRIGREARAPVSVNLLELVDGVLAEFIEPISARGVKVICHPLARVWTVRTQMEQVLRNLVGNAIKYLGDTPSPVVEIGTIDRGAFVECYVRDNGIGIDAAYHDKVFEIFQRLKDVETEGTGVGLAIVKKIVESAGGRIWVESAKGHGAIFRFTWPQSPRREAGEPGA